MKKRGDITTGTVVTLILLVLAAVVLISVINVFNSGMAGSVQDVVCAFSVRLAHKSQIIAGSFSIFPMACYEKKIELIEGTKDEVMKQIADLMATCWWMYGEGKFGAVKGRFIPLGKDPIYSCYVVDNLKIKDGKGITYDDFYNFLMGKKWDRGKGVDSYYNYFEGASEGNNICLYDNGIVDSKYDVKVSAFLFTGGKPVYIKFYDDDDKLDEKVSWRNVIVSFFYPSAIGGPMRFKYALVSIGTNVDKIIVSNNKNIKTKNCVFMFRE